MTDWRDLTLGQRLSPHAVLVMCDALHGSDDIYEEGGIAGPILAADVFVVREVEIAAVHRSVPTDPVTVREYAVGIARDGACPPVIVDLAHGRLSVLDGNHRLDALALLGRRTALALVAEGR